LLDDRLRLTTEALDDCLPQVQTLDATLRELMEALRQALPSVPTAESAPLVVPGSSPHDPSDPEAANLLHRLRQLLDAGDSHADRWLAEHATALAPLIGEHFPAVLQAIADFDFERALELLPAPATPS
jgi:hypothetical protein